MDLYCCYGCKKKIVQVVKAGKVTANGQCVKPASDYTSLDLLIRHQDGHAAFATPVCKPCAFKAMSDSATAEIIKQILKFNLYQMLLLYPNMIPPPLIAKGRLNLEDFELIDVKDLTEELKQNRII